MAEGNRKYSLMEPDEQAALAEDLANRLKSAFEGDGTKEDEVGTVAQIVRIIGSSDLVDSISAHFEDGLRQALVGEYSNTFGQPAPWGEQGIGDLKNILNAFGYAGHQSNRFSLSDPGNWFKGPQPSTQEKQAKLKNLDITKSHFNVFGNTGDLSIDELPDYVGGTLVKVGKEGVIPSYFDSSAIPKDLGSRVSQTTKTPQTPQTPKGMPPVDPREAPWGVNDKGEVITKDPTSKPIPQKTKAEELKDVYDAIKLEAVIAQRNLQKKQIERANRLRERRGVLKSGYQGGVDQYDYDQGLLKGNRLGDKFRLRTPEEREARVREGQYNITAPRRKAEANMAATIKGMKQWADDTTGAPKALEDPDLTPSRKQAIQSNRDAALKQVIRSVSGKQPNRLPKYTAPKEPPAIPDEEKDLWEKNKKNTARMNRFLSKI